MIAGMVARQTVMAPSNTGSARLGDYGSLTSRNATDERSTRTASIGQTLGNGTKAWGANIWSTGTLGANFTSSARDSSRSREKGSFQSSGAEAVEGKTGSGSLVVASEQEEDVNWNRPRASWSNTNGHSNAHVRTAGVSPVRQRTNPQVAQPQSFLDGPQTSAPYYGASRPAVGQGLSKSIHSAFVETAPGTYATSQKFNSLGNGNPSVGRFTDLDTQRASEPTSSWAEAVSVHSPNEDRRSVSNSDYFESRSTTASRSGSLPSSRHGAEPMTQFAQAPDTFSQYNQAQLPSTVRGHATSLYPQMTGRIERHDSFHGDTLPMLGRLSINNDTNQGTTVHRGSTSGNGGHQQPPYNPCDMGHLRHPLSDNPHTSEDAYASGSGSYTPDGWSMGQSADHLTAHRGFRLDRGAITPNGSDFRQSPFYSTGGTPPVFDHLYPSRNDPSSRTLINGQAALLEKKLRGLQQEQHTVFYPQYQQMLATQLRAPYNPYLYGVPNGIPMHGLPHNMPLPVMNPMMPGIEPPRAPHDHDTGNGIRSALLEEFKSNNKTSRRYELKDIYDHIVEFSGDQHGSRFIQQKLETANSDEKERVFNELQPEALQLMQDVFGNYVIQKFFEHGDQNQKKILANGMKGHIVALSLQMYGCRVVQKALEHILTDQQAALVKELEGHVLKCVRDQNGNHVIQKAIERVPPQHIQFIVNAFSGQVGTLAVHPYGCRVLQRMLEYCDEPARYSVLQELHATDSNLITDQYGNYVAQHIIEHGRPEDRAKVIARVKDQLLVFSRHKFASNVVEKCLIFGTDEQRRDMMLKALERNEQGQSMLAQLIKDSYGNYVIQKFLDTLDPANYNQFLDHLQPEMVRARRTVVGKQLQSVEKKMHRHDRHDGGADFSLRNGASSPGIGTYTSAATTPPLTNDTRSPQSSSAPSASHSAASEPLQRTSSKDGMAIPQISIATVV